MPPYPKACYFRICPLKLQRPPTPFLPGHHPTGGHPYEPRSRRYYLATPRLRRINEPASSEVDISRARDNPEASQLNGPHISEIVLGTRDCGANVNRDGMLEIKSGELSRRLHKTALILSRASSSLTEYDIRRILEIQNDAHEHAADGGLEEGPYMTGSKV